MVEETEKLTAPFAVRIFPTDLEWLQAERDGSGVSVNSMITTAVRQYVKQRKGVRARRRAS